MRRIWTCSNQEKRRTQGGKEWSLYQEESVVLSEERHAGQGAAGNKSWVVRFWDTSQHNKL